MTDTLRIRAADFLAEPAIYCRLQERGVTVRIDDGSVLVPSTPAPCEDCEDGSDHAQCRWVRGLVLELERVTPEQDARVIVDDRPTDVCPECGALNPYGGDYDHAYYGNECDPPAWAPIGASALRCECECGHSVVFVTARIREARP